MAETGAALTRHRNARECSRRGRGFAVEFDLGQIDHLLSTTRAVRRRLDLDRPVPDDLLLRCIDLAEQAPSGGNQTARRWLVVKDPTVKAELADLYRAVGVPYLRSLAALVEGTRGAEPAVMDSSLYLAENLHRVPALVVVAIEGVHNGPPTHPGLYGDVLQAAWSFCLAARSRGLGTAWTTLHLNRAAETAQLLGIPDGVTQVALFPVGWTTGDDFKPVARRPAAEITYFDQWGLTQTPAADGAGPAHRPSVTVDAKIAADLQVVWDLLLDLPGAGVVASEWDEQLPARAATADVATCDPRRAFAWRSADARTRAAHWQFRMEPTVVVSANPRPGTLLVYRATLRSTPEGPGDGGAIRRQLRDEMRRTLRAIQDRAERAAASM
ncbi:MAG: nitroreductase family protein [Sporichthyaceae bacterium]